MIELRDYQKDLLERVQKSLEPDKARVMMQLPTGGGKTVIAAHLLSSRLTGGRKAVWLTHRKELAGQTRRMLRETARIRVPPEKRWVGRSPAPHLMNGVMVLMAQTAALRAAESGVWSKYDEDDLMIIDEAHHATAKGYELAMKRWRGRVLGMTATPWRLSEREGFDHLFGELICGPQVTDLQANAFLCRSRVLVPPPDERILGGEIGSIGDYTESGIERANDDRPDIMTAGALRFWKEHAHDRQTIVYAVSVRHAHNLMEVFKEAGIGAGIMLGDTPLDERAATIEKFRSRHLQVLVNVAVATEGFDLPDASCVVIARPTESLTLYLQMVGRGLRPKPDGGVCVILDLAGNSLKHGLAEDHREWSLSPREAELEGEGDGPVVWCEICEATSPAASHNCHFCGAPFGEDCQRCGKWRAWKRWSLVVKHQVENSYGVKRRSLKNKPGCPHDLVCDLCHKDAHLQAHLLVTDEMEYLASQGKDGLMEYNEKLAIPAEYNDTDERLAMEIGVLLHEERTRILAENQSEQDRLREFIDREDGDLQDDEVLDRQFEDFLRKLPPDRRPGNRVQERRMFGEWEGGRKKSLAASRAELARLKSQTTDISSVFVHVQDRLMRILRREAEVAGLPTEDATADQSQGQHRASDMVRQSTANGQVRRRRPRGDLLPMDSYTKPTLVVLLRMGGEGATRDVIRQVGDMLNDQFTPKDLELQGSGTDHTWRNRIQWNYQKLKKVGYVDTNAPRGTWRLTSEGRELAEKFERESA